MADVSVRVALRVRPLVPSELEKGCQSCVIATETEKTIQVRGTDKAFTFNYVFPPEVSQERFYNTAVRSMICNLFKGYNVTILAYGQTGSGKTHSMGTSYNEGDEMGVIPRSIQEIFRVVETKPEWDFKITVAFMELYQEQLYDLLSNKSRESSIVDIREDSKGIKIPGLTEKEVNNVTDTIQCLTQGSLGRATGATAMNAQSSRSHAIFTVTINQQQKDDLNSATTAKFHLVDLAGSERSKKTKATGERFKEGVNINKGLLALGNVISLLGDGNSHNYIGYRDSKLTRLLQDSLGGNSMTLMIACISPADYNLDETMSTLRYADRALRIKNKPVVNQDPNAAEINRLHNLVQDLRLQLLGKTCDKDGEICPPAHKDLQEKIQIVQAKNKDLTMRLHSYLVEFVHMHEQADLFKKASQTIDSTVAEILNDLKEIIDSMEGDTSQMNEYSKLKTIYEKILAFKTNIEGAMKEISDCELINDRTSATATKLNVNDDLPNEVLDDDNDCEIMVEEMDIKAEEHTLEQADRKDAVQSINRELAVKEALVSQLLARSSHMIEYSKDIEDMEQEIKKLQTEKEELLKALDNVQTNKASVKIAETRRKKVQELEKKISALSQKCMEQASIIKVKEKSDVHIKNLTQEIQTMKQNRVKLMRDMRTESEKFRQWKLMKEQEHRKLRDQHRKQQNQIIQMATRTGKLESVLKRKVEESCAIKKRLKDALDKQRNAQQKRDKSGNAVNIQSWVTEEMDVLMNTIDAERSLEQLLQDRALVTQKLNEIKANESLYDPESYKKKIEELTEDLHLRSAQISDLQQKILDSDQENKKKTRLNMVHSMGEAKIAINTLFDIAADTRKKHFEKNYAYDELMEKNDGLQFKIRQLELQQKAQSTKQREQITRMQSEHEEHIAHLLMLLEESNRAKLQENIREENVSKEDVGEEDDIENTSPNKNLEETYTTPQTKRTTALAHLYEQDVFTDDSVIEDDVSKDPDWTKTPLYNRISRLRTSTAYALETDTTVGPKRSFDGEIKCRCKSNCSTRLCSCRKHNVACTNCGCNSSICRNKDSTNATQFRLFTDNECEDETFKRPT